MVFPSVPVYLDPSNWNQQQADQPGGSTGGGEAQHQLALPPQPGAAPRPEAGMAAGSVRQGSMAERARLAKMPQPEPALNCPRCDSTNTKFCYFNNYSLSQPRHFCKTCRRYWTRGGALRNVPVGGGCRRNKRSKASSSSSKSSASNSDRQAGASSSCSTATSASSGAIPSHMPPLPQLPFMASLHPLPDYGASNIGINFTGIQPMDTVEYQVGSTSSIGLEQWRLQQIQQFPFVGGLEPPPQTAAPAPVPWLFPFDTQGGVHGGQYSSQLHTKASSSGLITQLASVKMEGNPQGLDLPRQFLGLPNNDQYWTSAGRGSNASGGGNSGGGASGWPADLSGFNSSSSGNLL